MKFVLSFLLFAVFVTGCSNLSPLKTSTEKPSPVSIQVEQPITPKFFDKDVIGNVQVVKKKIYPGVVSTVEINLPKEVDDIESVSFLCDGIERPIFLSESNKKKFFVIVAESYFATPKKKIKCFAEKELDDTSSQTLIAELSITYKKYPKEKINVAKKKVDYSPEAIQRIIREKKELKEVYKQSSPIPLFRSPFTAPLKSRLTSEYGTKRIFNNKKKSQHLGTDFKAKIGTPIPVANDGKVIYVNDTFFSGNLVIVDHGLGIFSNYAHLSKITVNVGDVVKKGQIVGEAGMTGRVSGPHLHWGVKVSDYWVDGMEFIKESQRLFL